MTTKKQLKKKLAGANEMLVRATVLLVNQAEELNACKRPVVGVSFEPLTAVEKNLQKLVDTYQDITSEAWKTLGDILPKGDPAQAFHERLRSMLRVLIASWETRTPRQGDVLEQVSTGLQGVLAKNITGKGWQVKQWGSTRAGGWWDTLETLMADEDTRVVVPAHRAPEGALRDVFGFIPSDTPPLLREDILGAVEMLLEEARGWSARPLSSRKTVYAWLRDGAQKKDHPSDGSNHVADNLLRHAARTGALIRSSHEVPIEDCICHETTHGKECPVHGKHWAVREQESWVPEHGMRLVCLTEEVEATLIYCADLPNRAPCKWVVMLDSNAAYQFSTDEDLRMSWKPLKAKVSDPEA